jgi:hypothetical protein
LRAALIVTLLSLLALPVLAAAPCNLELTLTCTSGHCTATTTNLGTTACTGQYIAAFFSELSNVSFSGMTTSLGLETCFDSTTVPFEGSGAFAFCLGEGQLGPGASFTASTNLSASGATLPSIPIIALTDVEDFDGNELAFVYAFNDIVVPTCTPTANVAPVTLTGVPYSVSWTPVLQQQATYVVEESTSADFSTITDTRTTQSTSQQFQHTVAASTTYYYRVHAQQCSGSPGPLSTSVSIVVQAVPPATSRGTDAVVPFGTTAPVNVPLAVTLNVAGKQALDNATFTAKTDKNYLTVTPTTGTVPASGTVNFNVTATPGSLPPGANTGTVTVSTNTGQTTNVPVSISLVTPVSPSGKTLPPANALIIPIVTHVNSFTGPFQSDARLTNSSLSQVKYQITYTPTNTDGTTSSKSTTVPVDAGQTIALNDIVKDFFGFGAAGEGGNFFGSLEIRPVNNSTTQTYASSRTYITTDKGTLGQFIAAVPFFLFASQNIDIVPIPGQTPPPPGLPTLSLQQVAQSAKFRTNLGVVEGSGLPVDFRIRLFDDHGVMLKEKAYSLRAGEHRQFNQFITNEMGVASLEDGRIEIVVDSENGAVSGYASVLDNITTDPMAVMPVQPTLFQATRYVLPGMSEFVSPFTNFHSDVRLYNGGATSVLVTPTFFPQGNGTPVPASAFTLGAGEVKAVDNILPTMFNASGGGSVVFTTSVPSNLVTSGRTYTNADGGGTFGQFIPGVAPLEGVGAGDNPLQLLQLEESQNFRTNLGLAELTGNPVHVKVTALIPESKTAASTEFDLAANEFRQLGSILGQFGFNQGTSSIYNARISVQVLSGSGRVTAYGSVIDNFSKDPTYVPAQ